MESRPFLGVCLIPWHELPIADPDQKWIVDGLLPLGGTSLLCAQPKVGKTTLSYGLAKCVSEGLPFLGRETKQGSVAMLLMEGIPWMHREKLVEVGLTEESQVTVLRGAFGKQPFDEFEELMESVDPLPTLVIVDTLFHLLGVKDGNDYATMVPALKPFAQWARQKGVHLLFIHHAGKSPLERSTGGHAVGSTAISGAFDTNMLLRKMGRIRFFESENRGGTEFLKTALVLDPVTQRMEVGQSAEELKAASIRNRIFEYLENRGKMTSESDIRAHVKSNEVASELRAMVEESLIGRIGEGHRGHPFMYGLLAED